MIKITSFVGTLWEFNWKCNGNHTATNGRGGDKYRKSIKRKSVINKRADIARPKSNTKLGDELDAYRPNSKGR